MFEQTHDGRAFRILNVIDEFTRESLAVRVERHLGHEEVQECLTQLFCERGVPVHIRSDNGPEFIAQALREWLNRLSVKPLFIEPGSPWENGYVESFNMIVLNKNWDFFMVAPYEFFPMVANQSYESATNTLRVDK